MILYNNSPFGITLLARVHGSAAFRALGPTLFATIVLSLMMFVLNQPQLQSIEQNIIIHPYGIGCLIAASSFLLIFRANFSYNRYWEACTSVHLMRSKWLDAAILVCTFHYQSSFYEKQRPVAAHENPEGNIRRNRETKLVRYKTMSDMKNHIDRYEKMEKRRESAVMTISCDEVCSLDNYNVNPSHLLKEILHLSSLLSAIALCTLRNDLECVESPLAKFKSGEPWPPVDPDTYSDHFRETFLPKSRVLVVLQYLTGQTRTPKMRTLYNAARPFRVIGGVSDSEARMLQAVRGDEAKVALCSFWLQELVTREQLEGGLGKVPPPIVSRYHQFISDGMLGYHQSAKITYTPFPFPHAQITSIFVFFLCFLVPLLMICFVENVTVAIILNFFTMLCFVGLHEVARELEQPFINSPNDLPLNYYQAQFNEALQVMFTGFHPDCKDLPEDEVSKENISKD